MASPASPVELPTSRTSFINVPPSGDMKDPQWIPVLRKAAPHYEPSQEKELSPYTGATFSPMPSFTTDMLPPAPKSPSIHSYSRSSVAPETVDRDGGASPPPAQPLPPLPPIPPHPSRPINFELPATRPTSRYFEKAHVAGLSGDATVASTDTETTGYASRSESNADTSVTTDDAASVREPTSGKEDTSGPAPSARKEDSPSLYPRSTRSSYASTTKKYSVGPPTSKFNRKPAGALPSRITSLQSGVTGPPVRPSSLKSADQSRTTTPAASPRLSAFPPLPTNLEPSPSTASSQAPSLRPQPSDASLASHSSSPDPAPPVVAAPPPARDTDRPAHPPRISSASGKAERATSHGPSQPLSPPPPPPPSSSSPPPPPSIERPPGRRDSAAAEERPVPALEQPETARLDKPEAAKLAPLPRPGPSAGISSFMTATDTVIFRRFDEVHVQLLLCLQDEITQLERELMRLESAVMTRSERDTERSRVIRELRKVVAEYDHLFSSWSQMQASKASKGTQQSLRTWLERPATSAGAAPTAIEELNWLKESKDLSAVNLRQTNVKGGGGSGGGVGNFMGSICGKRK